MEISSLMQEAQANSSKDKHVKASGRGFIKPYVASVLLIAAASFAWEFWVEHSIYPLLGLPECVETATQHWEYFWTVLAFTFIALVIPFVHSLRLESSRQAALDALLNLRRKSRQLFEESTIELGSKVSESTAANSSGGPEAGIGETTQVPLRRLIDSISDSIMVIDTNFNVRMLNRAAREKHLHEDEEIPDNLLCYALSHEHDSPCSDFDHECPLIKIMEKGRGASVIHHHYNKFGEKYPVEIMAAPVRDDDGEIIGIIEMARDVSSRLEEQQKQREADARLLNMQREQSISTLAGGLAHEFNNILTSIMGNAELLNVRIDDASPNQKQVGAILTGSEQLADLTKQLLAYAKGGKYQSQLIQINDQVMDSLRLIETQKLTGIDLEHDLAEDLWPVSGDPAQISQLIMNIIINGFEALIDREGKVVIRTANLLIDEKWACDEKNILPSGEYVQFSVTNTGPTIPDDLRNKIFEPFFTTKSKGRGMGLAAVQGIVENHHGCITVESSDDQTTFKVLLPRGITEREILAINGKSAEKSFDFKVLVVDDEPQVLSIIKGLLDHQGCDVLSADKGKEALETIERHKSSLDLVVLDIQMPDMRGDEVYKKLKRIKPDLKVLISSGLDEYSALKNIMLDPRDKFIKKPFRMAELMMKVKELTE